VPKAGRVLNLAGICILALIKPRPEVGWHVLANIFLARLAVA
jgi:hypothetical protein